MNGVFLTVSLSPKIKGAMGYSNPAGDFDFNVVIRTAIVKDDHLFYSVGGAITSDSVASDEWKETRALSKLCNVARRGEIEYEFDIRNEFQCSA